MIYLNLILMLIVILVAAEIFTNALEHLGQKLEISEGVTGSIFAAVGTALPETSIPLIAILGTHQQNQNSVHDIGIGAILGAPLMLSTLAFTIMALAVIKKRGFAGSIKPEKKGTLRDLNYFLFAYLLATAALFVPHQNQMVRFSIFFVMVSVYIVYLFKTFKASKGLVQAGHQTTADHPLFIEKIGLKRNLSTIYLQVIIGLIILFFGAKGFIKYIDEISIQLNISVLLLSVLIVPIATELPEKINSVLWIRRNKDTMAFGNISGAMVFQGTLLPAIGILLTPWEPKTEVWTVIIFTMIAAGWVRWIISGSQLKVWHLLLCIVPYLLYLTVTLV